MTHFRQANRLSLHLLFYILLCSSVFTLFSTALQLYLDYKKDITAIETEFTQIHDVSLRPLATSLWNFNREQLQIQLEGLISFPDMQYAELRELRGSKEDVVLSIGAPITGDKLTRIFPLEYQKRSGWIVIGSVHVTASLSKVYDRLKDKILLVLVTQAVKTFFVSSLILMIFHYLIMKHLHTIAFHMREIRLTRLKKPLLLKRIKKHQIEPDLLDEVAESINDMQSRLMQDVAARETAEKALQISEEKYRALFESSPVSIWQLDLFDVEQLLEEKGLDHIDQLDAYLENNPGFIQEVILLIRVLDVNQATLKIFETDSKELLMSRFSSLFVGIKNELFASILKSIYIQDDFFKTEFQGRNLNGNELFLVVQCFMSKRSSNGTQSDAIMAVTDITERKKIEEILVQSEKLASIGNLAAGMAHEINNPLGAILQSSQNIRRRTSSELEKNRKVARELGIDFQKISDYMEKRGIPRFIEAILESGERAANIITKMLQFSRKSESKIIDARIDIILDRAIEMATTDYDLVKKFDFKHIRIVKEYSPDLGLVSVTESEMEQVFLNLLKNAAQALFDPLPVTSPCIRLSTTEDNGQALIEIEDNGPGMDEQTRKNVFEPFFTTKPVGQGTGLGLSVSYMIITGKHGGSVQVDSMPGRGTKFMIRLPMKPKDH